METNNFVSLNMATLLNSLSQSFRTVPSAAVPAMLDCILTSTGVPLPSLFDSLLHHFSNLTKEFFDANKKLDSEQCAYLVSYLRGLSHLIKKIRMSTVVFECFMRDGFIPLMKMVQLYEKDMLYNMVESLLEVVIATNNWEIIEATLVPVLLRSVVLSMDMDQYEDKSVITWSSQPVLQSSRDLQNMGGVCDQISLLPLALSCYLLSCLLDAAMENYQAAKDSAISGYIQTETLCGHLLLDLCNLTIQMLSQSPEHRSCTASLLLPSIFKAFAMKCSFEVNILGESCCVSRQHFFMKLWKCSQVLFSLGITERRDAYGIISLYLSYFPSVDQSQVEMDDRAEEFNIRAEKDFWDEIKRGLVEKEGLIRKQSLYILKRVMLINEAGQLNSIASEKKSHQRGSVSCGMTKRDIWAEEEAKSLGVGQICDLTDSYLTEMQKWQTFILLYEMLDEYGTHLVEAAWNHQIKLLLRSCGSHGSFMDPETLNPQFDVLGGKFDWIAILWERGLLHDNPHVRCLIMKSFLEIEWKNQGNCKALFPEEFLLGAFMQGLNDPVHHKDFGLKGVHSSKTIEAASKFFYHYSSSLCGREHILFLIKLASVARQQSLGRSGLMSLSECIFSASESSKISAAEEHGVVTGGTQQCIDGLSDINGTRSLRTQHCAVKADLIDSLRFIIENSKPHFNPNYRLRVCEKVIEAAVSLVCPDELSLETILHFIAALPREFIDSGGSLRRKLQEWFTGNNKQNCAANGVSYNKHITQGLCDFPRRFTTQYFSNAGVHYDDEDLVAWCAEAERWTRVLFLRVEEEHQLEPLFKFIEEKGVTICQQSSLGEWIPVKFLVLLLSLVHELEIVQLSTDNYFKAELKAGSKAELNALVHTICHVAEKFANVLLIILDKLISYSESSCSIFWSHAAVDTRLPGSVTGKLGGPSRRRLSSPVTALVLQAVFSLCFCTLFIC